MSVAIAHIQQLIAQGQDTRTHWFTEHVSTEEVAETLVAMANHRGGSVGLGIDNGQIIGVQDVDASMDQVLEAALLADPPLIIPLPQQINIDNDTSIIVIHIPDGLPHVYSFDGRYLQRQGGANLALKPAELRRLMIERGELSFETEMAYGTSRSDIDWERAKEYVNSLEGIRERDVEKVLIKRGCLIQQGGTIRPTNAGILLFGVDPQRHIRSAEITAVRFAGETMSDTFTRQDIAGTLPDQIRRAETFLVDNLRKNVELHDTMERQETFEYPFEAAREIVVNAVAHRDYSINGDTTQIFVYSNRMEVNSPGGLPGPITVDNMKDERFSRNPAIVQVLSDMGYIERLGYGVNRVFELMRNQNLQDPQFRERAGGIHVVLRNTPRANLLQFDTPMAQFNGFYNGVEITPRQDAALSFLHSGTNRITNGDLSKAFPDVHAETIRRELVDLVKKGILVKMGQKRGSYYVLKRGNENVLDSEYSSDDE